MSFSANFEGNQLVLGELEGMEMSETSLEEPESTEEIDESFEDSEVAEAEEEIAEKTITTEKIDLYFSINLEKSHFSELASIKPGEKIFTLPEQERICILRNQSPLGFGKKIYLGQQVALQITDWNFLR